MAATRGPSMDLGDRSSSGLGGRRPRRVDEIGNGGRSGQREEGIGTEVFQGCSARPCFVAARPALASPTSLAAPPAAECRDQGMWQRERERERDCRGERSQGRERGNDREEATKKGSVKKKTSFPARSCLLFICSYRCWKFNFLMQRAYMNAKNTAKSTSTGATTAMKLRWYPK